jgi:signal transduction histidine kinase
VRRLIALAILGLLLAVAVSVLYALGQRGLDAEAQRLESDARDQRRGALADIRDDVDLTLSGLTEREASRPYYHYRHLFLPPELVSNELALVPSPISAKPPEPLVRYFLEFRDGQLMSPAFLSSDLVGEEAPTPYAEEIRDDLLALLALGPVFRDQLEPMPGLEPMRSVAVDAYSYQLNMDPSTAMDQLARSNVDPQAASRLKGDWSEYQGRQGKSPGNYQPNSQRGQQLTQQQVTSPPAEVPVKVYPFRWLQHGQDADGWPQHLLALRRIEVADGRSWLQGFALDVDQLRVALLPELIATYAPPTAGPTSSETTYGKLSRLASLKRRSYRPAVACAPAASESAESTDGEQLQLQPPLEILSLTHTTPTVDRRDLLSESRQLLDGSLALVIVVVLLGGLILIQAAIAERRLARQRSDFVAALTHELKAPLTGMRAMAELLRDGIVTDEPKRQEYYASILGESERLSRLVQNVLDASRLERGASLKTSIQTADVAPMLRDLAASFRPRLETEGFELQVDVPDLPPVRVDPEAFLQIVANLLDNAFKYGRGEVKRITLSAVAAGSTLAVRVADQGPGVPSPERAKVFRRFFRSGSSPSEVGGAGLGLAIARAQAEAMHGKLLLEDTALGASFCLHAPLATEGAA